jgi:hypothetical protein
VRVAKPLNSALAALASVFRRAGVGWYLFGAQAVALHGVPRFTADLDVTVEEPPGGIAEFIRQLSSAGFEFAVDGDPEEFAAVARVLPFIHRRTGLPIDIVIAGPGLEEEILRRAVPIRVGRTRVPTVSLEDLLVLKLLAGRPKDLDDVGALIAEYAERMDAHAVRERLGILEKALGQSDLLPLFERLLDRR